MKFLNKKIYIISLIITIFLIQSKVLSRDNTFLYTKENISNYFLGTISANKDQNSEALKYLEEVRSLKNKHSKFNIKYLRTLVSLNKFDEAIAFSKSVWVEKELFFEADLLLGLDSFIKEDYKNAERHFKRLNEISRYNYFFDDFVGNILIAWSKASQENKSESFLYLQKIPKSYRHVTQTQNSFIKCYFNDKDVEEYYKEIVFNKEFDFSRYSFFLANYLLFNNKTEEAKKVIQESRKKHNSNLLLRHTENSLINNQNKKIKNFFDCRNAKDSISEFFYVIANLYSSENEYQLSNFYLKISLYLNNKFLTNKALLAENFYYQKKYKLSKKVYKSLKSIGPIYSWYSAKSIARILSNEKGEKYSIQSLEKEFNLITNPNFEHYYEMANFYKDNKYYEKSIEYYSLSLEKIDKQNSLIPKILDRRGTSYERLGKWDEAEKDLLRSLEILPDQAHVLNYLAYTWIDKGINLDEGLAMLKRANEIRKEDGYIIDSLGWAYYAKENYTEAEKFLQKAVELLPQDPVINDHYGDTLWMLNKDIQARYVWNYVLKLDDTEQKLKDDISNKLIFGLNKNYN